MWGGLARGLAVLSAAVIAGAAAPARMDDLLMSRLARGEADPANDAAAAVRRGDFRLVWTHGFIFHTPMGVICDAPVAYVDGVYPLEFASRFVSDVVGDCGGSKAACDYNAALDTYGPAYNKAVVDSPAFPYPDVCRPFLPEDRERSYEVDEWRRYATPVRRVTGPPHDLHEAARRGTPDQVRAALRLAATPDALDVFGMSPLAWAVTRDRTETVRLLMAAGADPLAGSRGPASAQTALMAGLRLAREPAVAMMLTPAVQARIDPSEARFVKAAVQGGDLGLTRRMLALYKKPGSFFELFQTAYAAKNVQLLELLIEAGGPAAVNELASVAAARGDLQMLKTALARGASPNGAYPGSTLLNSVAYGEHDNDEALTELLIKEGVDLERSIPGPYGSNAGNVLVQAVTYAFREPMSHEADRVRALRQQRLIDLLIKAGVRPVAFPGQPPLVFAAVIGANRNNEPSPKALIEPLPGPVLSRLKAAGMDLNAAYKGRTVLDWVEAVGGDKQLASDLRSLGARRLAELN